jgi:drug/metabolite transporter (DMT)-like permease
MDKYHLIAHFMSFFVSFVWGVTFVSSKIILEYYTPVEILIMRFSLAYILLWIIYPKSHKFCFKDDIWYFMAGITGVSLYFLFENTALIYSTASNVGVILSSVPIMVAIIAHLFSDDEKFHKNMFYGFIITITGVAIVIFNGQVNLHLNPLGDMLALLCCFVWGFYNLAIKKMDTRISNIFRTRRVFFYGLVTVITYQFIFEGSINLNYLSLPLISFNLIFLGLVASGVCFVFYNHAIKVLGSITTSNYLYLMPVFTVITSTIVLKERLTILIVIGCALIITGTYISDRR